MANPKKVVYASVAEDEVDDDDVALADLSPTITDSIGGGAALTVTDGTTTVANVIEVQATVVEDEAGVAVIKAVIFQEADPGAVGPGVFWLRLMPDGGTNTLQLYVRAEDDLSWLQASAGVGAGDWGDGFVDNSVRDVGGYVGDPADGNFVGLNVAPADPQVSMSLATDDMSASVTLAPTQIQMVWGGAVKSFTIQMNDTGIYLYGDVPTVDPVEFGALWQDGSGFLKRSAGP